jgi:hypothetical protein
VARQGALAGRQAAQQRLLRHAHLVHGLRPHAGEGAHHGHQRLGRGGAHIVVAVLQQGAATAAAAHVSPAARPRPQPQPRQRHAASSQQPRRPPPHTAPGAPAAAPVAASTRTPGLPPTHLQAVRDGGQRQRQQRLARVAARRQQVLDAQQPALAHLPQRVRLELLQLAQHRLQRGHVQRQQRGAQRLRRRLAHRRHGLVACKVGVPARVGGGGGGGVAGGGLGCWWCWLGSRSLQLIQQADGQGKRPGGGGGGGGSLCGGGRCAARWQPASAAHLSSDSTQSSRMMQSSSQPLLASLAVLTTSGLSCPSARLPAEAHCRVSTAGARAAGQAVAARQGSGGRGALPAGPRTHLACPG